MNDSSWAAVIPAYRAAGYVAEVITGVAAYFDRSRILVVDDGSDDDTAVKAQECGIRVLQRLVNGGKGCALRDGFERALLWDPTWILCLDADGQHDPKAIPQFQQAAQQPDVDLLIGDRSGQHGEMPLSRRFSNRVSSVLLSLRTGMPVQDAQCGYRAIRADALRRMKLRAEHYDIEAEMILEAWRLGCKIGWIAVPTLYREERSSLRKVPETVRFLGLLTRSLYAKN